jgi:hypothetical protein
MNTVPASFSGNLTWRETRAIVVLGKAHQLEAAIFEMTQPINGQYPRPWMTAAINPASAQVFTVGRNQRNPFPVGSIGSHERYVDTLFNRGPETCRQLYDRLIGKPSPTRKNTDDLVWKLAQHGVRDILETNVICYSTPMSADLWQRDHYGGAARGRDLFQGLLHIVRPKVLIAHGRGTTKELERVLGHPLPVPPEEPSEPLQSRVGELVVFVIPSLAPPGWNKWSSWAQGHLDLVCRLVADHLV